MSLYNVTVTFPDRDPISRTVHVLEQKRSVTNCERLMRDIYPEASTITVEPSNTHIFFTRIGCESCEE